MSASTLLAAHTETGPLRWASLPPAWLLTVLIVVGFFWIRSLYKQERGRAGPFARHGLALLRLAALVCVLLVLGGPFRVEERRAVEKSHLVVLVDSSASMNVKDVYEPDEARALMGAAWPAGGRPSDLAEVSRGELVKRTLTAKNAELLRTWSDRFVLHLFAFDGDWRSLGTTYRGRQAETEEETETPDAVLEIAQALESMPTDGGRTRLGGVLRNAANEFGRRQDQHLAGVVLISDGRDTSDGEPPQQVLTALGPIREQLQVTAIGLGNPASGKNMWVDRIRAKDVVLVDDKVSFETGIRHTGFEGSGPLRVTMSIEKVADEDGTPIAPPQRYDVPARYKAGMEMQLSRLGPENVSQRVRLAAPFLETGTFRVSIRGQFTTDATQRQDAVQEDNVRTREIRVKDQRIKVLYVDNWPRYDWRFLSNYLTREPGGAQPGAQQDVRSRFEVHVLLQSADPTYRQPSSVGITPIKHFPDDRQELFAYDVLILGDVDWSLLSRSGDDADRRIMGLIADFVQEGGGLALQAGEDYNNPLRLDNTPMAPLVPLNISQDDRRISDKPENRQTEFRIRLTEAGALNPIFSIVADGRGPTTPQEIAQIWEGKDSLSEDWKWWWMYRAKGGLRPGAIDLARVWPPAKNARDFFDQRGEPLVVFATMPYGRGQVFWSSLDTISKLRREQRDGVYGKFWDQVIRYLATYRLLGGNKRYKIFTDKDEYFVGQTAEITITALDDKFEPLREPRLEGVHVEFGDDPTTAESRLLEGENAPKSLADQDGQQGTYRLLLPLKKKGLVRVWIDRSTTAGTRATKERAEKRFEVTYRTREDILKVPDHKTLEDIVRETNPKLREPRIYALHEIGEAVASVQARPRERVLDRRERTQWDKQWVLLLITALLALEWGIRKRLQMI